MMKNNRLRCIQERENAINAVLVRRQTRTLKCYMGLTYFMSPVFYHGEIICMAYGGGVNIGQEKICAGNKQADNIPVISEKSFSNMLDVLQNMLDLLDLDGIGEKEAERAAVAGERSASEYLFLKNKLSRREMEIAQAVCECLSNKQIGNKLFISEKTVKSHISNILAKMGMKDRMQLVMFCKEHNKE
jgi:DNA-binding CsgD family transcriptional regulator